MSFLSQAQTYQFVREISGYTQNPPLYDFATPVDVTTDPQGNIYVTDNMNYRVAKFDASGNYLLTWPVNTGGSNGLGSIAADALGNIYVCDFNGRVLKYTNTGQLLLAWGSSGSANGQFSGVRGIAVDASGNVYVCDQGNNRIQKFTSSGVFITKWGTAGSGNGQFDNPLNIEVDASGNVYVTESSTTTRIQKFTSTGVFITKWGSAGSGNGQFNQFGGITADNAGNVFVSDWGNNRIQKFTSSGAFISTWGSGGAADGQFSYPAGSRVDPVSGNLFVVDMYNNRIQKFTTNGVFLSKWGSSRGNGQLSGASGVAINNTGYTYVVDRYNNRIQKFDPAGNYISQWGSYGSGNGQFASPTGIAIDANNNVYITDLGNARVQKFTTDGVYITQWGGYGAYDSGVFGSETGIYAIAVDAAGFVYVADGSNSRITKHTSTGTLVATWGTSGTGNGQFNNPVGITVSASGDVYVSDKGNNRIQKFTSAGVFVATWGTLGSTNGQFGSLGGIATDAAGNVFTTETSGISRIQKFTSTGVFITTWGVYGTANGQFYGLQSVAVDNTGKIYSAEARRVQVFAPPASILTGVNASSYCQGQVIAISYSAVTTFTSGNTFAAYLSDPSGSFVSGTTLLGNVSSVSSGVINAVVPISVAPGTKYRVRVVGNLPYSVGNDNGADITINAKPILPPITGLSTVCSNQTGVVYSVAITANSTYLWTAPIGASLQVNGNSAVVNFGNASGNITVVETNAGACVSAPSILAVQVNASPQNNLTISGPVNACPQESGLVFKVTNNRVGAIYTWTVPVGATIMSGIGSAQITVSWANASGNVTVTETNSCGTGASNAYAVTTNAAYALSDVSVLCGSDFCLPLKTIGTIKNGLIGLDYVVNYDPALLSPTGLASLGPVATSYGAYRLNTTTPGKVYVSVYLQNAPSNTFFAGSGTLLCVNFKSNAIGTNQSVFTTNEIEESGMLSATSVCSAIPSNLIITGVVGGQIVYRNSTTNKLTYNTVKPSLYLPTSIKGYGSNCTLYMGSEVLTNTSGVFAFNPNHGPLLQMERDIKGDMQVPALQCANVQAVINSADMGLAAAIANYSNVIPTVYELLSSDVNLDGKVTSGDVTLISSRSVNANNCEFPQAWNYEWNGSTYVPKVTYEKSKDWLFVDDALLASSAFVTIGRNQVPSVASCLQAPAGTALCTPVVTATYHAILLGDVNGNWLNNSHGAQLKTSSNAEIMLDLSHPISNGTSQLIPVYYAGADSLSGVDFSIDYSSGMHVVNVNAANGIAVQWNNIENQRLMVSAYTERSIVGNYPILYLEISSADLLTEQSFSAASGYLNGEEASVRFGARTTAVDKASSTTLTEVFPNPSNGEVYVYVADLASSVSVRIYDVQGSLVYENVAVPSNENVLLPSFEAGVYVLKVLGTNGETTKKMVRY